MIPHKSLNCSPAKSKNISVKALYNPTHIAMGNNMVQITANKHLSFSHKSQRNSIEYPRSPAIIAANKKKTIMRSVCAASMTNNTSNKIVKRNLTGDWRINAHVPPHGY